MSAEKSLHRVPIVLLLLHDSLWVLFFYTSVIKVKFCDSTKQLPNLAPWVFSRRVFSSISSSKPPAAESGMFAPSGFGVIIMTRLWLVSVPPGCKYRNKGKQMFSFHCTSSASFLCITRAWRTRPLLTGVEEMIERKWLQRRFTLQNTKLFLALCIFGYSRFSFFFASRGIFLLPKNPNWSSVS